MADTFLQNLTNNLSTKQKLIGGGILVLVVVLLGYMLMSGGSEEPTPIAQEPQATAEIQIEQEEPEDKIIPDAVSAEEAAVPKKVDNISTPLVKLEEVKKPATSPVPDIPYEEISEYRQNPINDAQAKMDQWCKDFGKSRNASDYQDLVYRFDQGPDGANADHRCYNKSTLTYNELATSCIDKKADKPVPCYGKYDGSSKDVYSTWKSKILGAIKVKTGNEAQF